MLCNKINLLMTIGMIFVLDNWRFDERTSELRMRTKQGIFPSSSRFTRFRENSLFFLCRTEQRRTIVITAGNLVVSTSWGLFNGTFDEIMLKGWLLGRRIKRWFFCNPFTRWRRPGSIQVVLHGSRII